MRLRDADSSRKNAPSRGMEAKIISRMSPRQQKAFEVARKAAAQVIQRRLRLLRLVRDGFLKLSANENAMARVREDLRTLLRIARAWARREYHQIPWKSLMFSVAAIVYFISPVDLIPDALAVLGFLDDVAVITAVTKAVRTDMERFQVWERTQK